ncbi:Dual adapter for phosphotyrosine and 3-phosphotyrosine and 3-phosphoinositide [Geodia barretti]|uniref:Dual adapter for phosphotyrosine and 3-phosphotyrosine and 3-phosphoinositide n=1 Tax=Geodia barretti TaxID=519541 RepID=A0AA35T8L7_GEOBA|nr:Dual adapter for phosphotyrosine and 3-phosphotyrosine and 3-phosphoinositide [Geodia barretti]
MRGIEPRPRRTTHTVKHFPVDFDRDAWTFGQETFTSIPAFLEHFDNRPLLGDEGGKLIVLKYPYPREVEENPDYHSSVTAHFLSDPPKHPKKLEPGRRCQSDSEVLSNSSGENTPLSSSVEEPPTQKTTSIHSVSLASKAGYLVKMGAKVKSWKKRWFVLKDKNLSYYTKDTDTRPLRVIDLSQATSISCSDEYEEKANLFKIVLPWRTFYLQALTETLRREWVELLSWRLREIQRLPEASWRPSS